MCAQCGLVVAEETIDMGPEWRVFNKEKRVKTAPLKLVVKRGVRHNSGQHKESRRGV